MKHIKTYEKNIDGPKIGDYVICKEKYGSKKSRKFTSKKIGQFIYYEKENITINNNANNTFNYIIRYENVTSIMQKEFKETMINLYYIINKDENEIPVKNFQNCTMMSLNEIKYWAPTKEDCEAYIAAKKYNL